MLIMIGKKKQTYLCRNFKKCYSFNFLKFSLSSRYTECIYTNDFFYNTPLCLHPMTLTAPSPGQTGCARKKQHGVKYMLYEPGLA